MKQFFKFMFASMLGFLLASIVVFIIFLGVISSMSKFAKKPEVVVSKNTVLTLPLDVAIEDKLTDNFSFNFNSFSSDFSKPLTLNSLLETLKKAKTDDNISGIFMDLTSIPTGIGNLYEIRNALLDFKKSNKFIYAYSDALSQGGYYIATVADSIFLHPLGAVDFKGLSVTNMFYIDLIKKLDIEPQIIRHGKFKSAVEPFIQDKMSPESRLQTETFINSIWLSMLEGMSESRGISIETLNQIADGLLASNAQKALELKLVDQIAYLDEVEKIIAEKTNAESVKDISYLKAEKYYSSKHSDSEYSSDKIAIIYASGNIINGKDNGTRNIISDEKVSQLIRDARNDKKIKAIVFRVNSPGGDALASENIWREANLTKAEKPFIVSMGNYAASGGYYISSPANKIFANPTTITGSIGVFGIIPNLQKTFNNKVGITFDGVNTNKHSDFISGVRPMNDAEKLLMTNQIEEIYTTFIQRVADGRKMEVNNVDSIGQGRVWSGINARENGLVDELGGLQNAIDEAAKLAKLDNYRIVEFPRKKDAMELIMESLGGISDTKMKNQLGDFYPYWKTISDLKEMKGVQALMPQTFEIR